ncbi:MAG: hypothetical protein JNM85_01020 [Chthonomonas sp.]|nr:hypothetical protein [Chthonomonas sp.]
MEARKPIKKRWLTGFGVVMLFLLAGALLFQRSVVTVQVSGNSMATTFRSGQRLLASSAYWLVGPIERNDIIVFRLKPGGETFIKRVYKMGGDEVDWLNVPRDWRIENGPYRVPPGSLYVLGDNRGESEDSRAFGPLSPNQVLGKVVIAN